jgi:methionyl-tRNA synthetase
MLHHMSSTEYLNYEGGKFSKTRGVGVFGTDVMETGIAADVWRFYIFYNRPEKADALFTWKDFQEKVNGELIGNLGNLVNRTLSFVIRYYDGTIPEGEGGGAVWDRVRTYATDIAARLERADLREGFRLIFTLSSIANKTFQDGEPWRKRRDDPPAAETLIRDLAYVVRDMAVLVEPYMPQAAERIASFFGLSFGKDRIYKKAPDLLSWDSLGKDQGLDRVLKSEVLFAKLEDELVEELRERYSGSQKERGEREASEKAGGSAGAAGSVKSPDEVARAFAATLDLRVARIVKIERHPRADKLYIETLDIAGEERIIVSGLVPYYREEELLGRRIIVAYNLKAAKLRGVESRGMLLAASDEEGEGGARRVEILDGGDVPTGTRVCLEGMTPEEAPAEIDIDAFFSVPIRVKGHRVEAGGKALTLGGDFLRTKIISSGEVG